MLNVFFTNLASCNHLGWRFAPALSEEVPDCMPPLSYLKHKHELFIICGRDMPSRRRVMPLRADVSKGREQHREELELQIVQTPHQHDLVIGVQEHTVHRRLRCVSRRFHICNVVCWLGMRQVFFRSWRYGMVNSFTSGAPIFSKGLHTCCEVTLFV